MSDLFSSLFSRTGRSASRAPKPQGERRYRGPRPRPMLAEEATSRIAATETTDEADYAPAQGTRWMESQELVVEQAPATEGFGERASEALDAFFGPDEEAPSTPAPLEAEAGDESGSAAPILMIEEAEEVSSVLESPEPAFGLPFLSEPQAELVQPGVEAEAPHMHAGWQPEETEEDPVLELGGGGMSFPIPEPAPPFQPPPNEPEADALPPWLQEAANPAPEPGFKIFTAEAEKDLDSFFDSFDDPGAKRSESP